MLLFRVAIAVGLCAQMAVADTPLAVEIVTAGAVVEERVYSLTGEAVARETLSAAFPMGGRITEVLVEAGEQVAEGTALAKLDAVQQEQALRAAEAGLSTAKADFRQAMEDLQRQETLLQRGATTRIGRDSAEDALHIAEGVLAQAEADLDRATKALADTVLLAPESATVTQRMAEAGQVVGAAQPVMELALGSGFDAIFHVPEALLTIGSAPPEVTLNRIEIPDETFVGHISEISPVVEAQTGTVEVTVAVENPPHGLSYGDAVRGSVTRQEPPRVVLPYAAITATRTGPAVWRVDPETMTVSLLSVRIDRYETGRIVLSDGVEDGMMIVGRGAQLLYPGRVVRAAEGAQ